MKCYIKWCHDIFFLERLHLDRVTFIFSELIRMESLDIVAHIGIRQSFSGLGIDSLNDTYYDLL